MGFPKLLKTINYNVAVLAGAIVLLIGFFTTLEGVARGIFNSPTDWSLDVCRYLLIWVIFLGSGYTFQEKGHVAVDFIREGVGRKLGSALQRFFAVVGYVFALIYVCVLAWSCIDMTVYAVQVEKLTRGTIQIHIAWLYLAMLIGCVGMVTTLCFILLDLISGSDKYV